MVEYPRGDLIIYGTLGEAHQGAHLSPVYLEEHNNDLDLFLAFQVADLAKELREWGKIRSREI